MTTEPLKRFAYPFPKRAGDVSGNTVEMESVHLFLKSWVEVADGFFPIGINGQYHGGIHFDAKTGGTLEQDKGVRCIADGEVVAYRIDTVYPTSEYERGAASYSRGFVLVRHRLQVPQSLMPAPAQPPAAQPPATANASAPPAAAAPEAPSLIFFSLYMHLRRWDDYENDTTLARPGFWPAPADKKIVKPTTLNVRASANGQKLGTLAKDTKVTIEGSGEWVKVTQIDSGTYTPITPAPNVTPPEGCVGWVKKEYLASVAGQPEAAARDSIHVLTAPRPIAAGEIVGHLGNYMRYGETEANRPLLHLEVFAGPELPGFIERCRGLAANAKEADKNLLKIDVGAKLVNPAISETLSCAGKYVTLAKDSPKEGPWEKIAIGGAVSTEPKASLSGYDTKTNRYSNGKILLAFVSSAEEASELSKSDYDALSAAGKNGYTKRKVLAPSQEYAWVDRSLFDFGTTGVCTPSDDKYCWTKYPLQIRENELEPVKYLRIDEIKTLDKGEYALDDKGRRWWKLGVTVRTAEGASAKRTGWVCEKDHPGVERCSPWSWPGFEILPDDDTPPAQWYNKRLDGNYPPDNPLLKALFDVIDTNHDNRLSLAELMSVWQDDDGYGTTLSRKIIQHENEWGLPMSEWDKLDALMAEQGQPDLSGTWEVEKKRIESLRWWDQVQGKVEGFPPSIVAHNLHPVGVMGNFRNAMGGTLYCKKCGANITLTSEFIKGFAPRASAEFVDELVKCSGEMFDRYGLNTCAQVKHILAQAMQEATQLTSFRESLYYTNAERVLNLSPTAIRNGFRRRGLTFNNRREELEWIENNIIRNDVAYGYHLYGTNEQPGKDFRGRGLLHLTHYETYQRCARAIGYPIDSQPELVESNPRIIIETGLWFWQNRGIGTIADDPETKDSYTEHNNGVYKVTTPINSARDGLEHRKRYKREISALFNRLFNGCLDA